MKIAFFGAADTCDPMKIGGTESIIRRLGIGLIGKGHSVTVVMYGANNRQELNKFFNNDLTLQYYRSFSDALHGLANLQCDIVIETYIHKRYYPYFLAFKMKKRTTTKFSIIIMTSVSQSLKRWLRKSFRTMFCSTVFAVSQHLVNELQNDGISSVWLPPPVPEYFFSPRCNQSKKNIVISYLGRIDPNKGLDELLLVFGTLSCSSQLTLRIRGYYVPNNLKSVKLHESLQELGYVDYFAEPHNLCHYSPMKEQEVVRYLLETDILVLPYKNLKGTVDLPLLVLEGLATGCLVMSRDVGDIRKIIGSPALIALDFDEFKEKLERLSCTEVLAAEKARTKSLDLFSTFATTKIIDKLISHL